MSKHPLSEPHYRRDLGDGLLLRWATPADTEGLVGLYSYVFREAAAEPPNPRVAAWTRDLMSGRHPLCGPGEFAVVEDTQRGGIVGAACLMSQVWDYAGITLPVGRPETVASHPDYRNRGLVRAVFELIHARSAARGDLVQGITGIPFYYRQFDYEYALDLAGWRKLPFTAIPKLKEGEQETYSLRDATQVDLPLVLSLYNVERTRRHGGAPLLVSTRVDETYWRFTMGGQTPESYEGWRTQLIHDQQDQVVGYVLTSHSRWGDGMVVLGMAVRQGQSLAAVLPPVLRALQLQAQQLPTFKPDAPLASTTMFVLGREHPVYDVLGEQQTAARERPYAWYVRVPDLPGFIRHIAPVLEQRLAASPVAGHSGELRIDFYRGGLRLLFEQGRLAEVTEWRPGHNWGPRAQAGCPPLVFLQLVFGYRSLASLQECFPDVWAGDEGRVLLEALFPQQLSWVVPLA